MPAKYGRVALLVAGALMTSAFISAFEPVFSSAEGIAFVVGIGVFFASTLMLRPAVRAGLTSLVAFGVLTLFDLLPVVWPPDVHQPESLKFALYAVCLTVLAYAVWLQVPALRDGGSRRPHALLSIGSFVLGMGLWACAYLRARLAPDQGLISGWMVAEGMVTAVLLVAPVIFAVDGLASLMLWLFRRTKVDVGTQRSPG